MIGKDGVPRLLKAAACPHKASRPVYSGGNAPSWGRPTRCHFDRDIILFCRFSIKPIIPCDELDRGLGPQTCRQEPSACGWRPGR